MRCMKFLNQNQNHDGNGQRLKDQEWASDSNVLMVYHAYLDGIGIGIKWVLNRIKVWLEDEKIINVIFPSFQDQLGLEYQKFFNFCKFEFYELIKEEKIKTFENFKIDLQNLIYDD
ncbi:uncharacterized protein MELLADRAFT_106616 [Melampsora larici-populina 98AG31]|uniref:Uncharacterized protein n=1 Tax=Melampsora larici-populina (strain 98AG31 / pathotype 3-4-7) TaxID=747676 RepID=F4RM30_MELLP|nr:uncharacterized protein MELLADRAFT_106616 [Melampsora larici-populina 98AG31]EGG06650.1 hypothetical protein MELLADRAFT_106616 [Melampsora larici-populina 98AG31]